MPTMISFMLFIPLHGSFCSRRLVHDDVGGSQQLAFPQEAGADLLRDDAGIALRIGNRSDRTRGFRVERAADQIERYDATVTQHAVETIECHAQSLAPSFGSGVVRPAAHPAVP